MNKSRWLVVTLAFLMCFGAVNIAQAETQKEIKKDFKFTAKTAENLEYKPPKKIEEGGKKYKISNKKVKYKVLKDNKISKTLTVFSNNATEEGIEKEIKEGDNNLKLQDLTWEENKEKVVASKTYDAENKITDSISSTKKVDGEIISITLAKKSTETFTEPQNFTAPAIFIGHPDSPYYIFNGKLIELTGSSPNWHTWKTDAASYLGINNSEYVIESMVWTGGFTELGNNRYQRIATISGTRHVPAWTVQYEEAEADYKGTATYEGIDKNIKVDAVATAWYLYEYEEKSSLSLIAKLALTIAGLLIIGLIAGILMYLSKKKNNKNS